MLRFRGSGSGILSRRPGQALYGFLHPMYFLNSGSSKWRTRSRVVFNLPCSDMKPFTVISKSLQTQVTSKVGVRLDTKGATMETYPMQDGQRATFRADHKLAH